MLNIYNTDIKTNKFEKIEEFRPGSWISLISEKQAVKRHHSDRACPGHCDDI